MFRFYLCKISLFIVDVFKGLSQSRSSCSLRAFVVRSFLNGPLPPHPCHFHVRKLLEETRVICPVNVPLPGAGVFPFSCVVCTSSKLVISSEAFDQSRFAVQEEPFTGIIVDFLLHVSHNPCCLLSAYCVAGLVRLYKHNMLWGSNLVFASQPVNWIQLGLEGDKRYLEFKELQWKHRHSRIWELGGGLCRDKRNHGDKIKHKIRLLIMGIPWWASG